MNTVTLQVPMSKTLRINATKKANEMGFSSLQEFIRVMLNRLSQNLLSISIEEAPTIRLSKKNDDRYNKMIQDIESDKEKMKNFDDIDEMMNYLRS